MQATVLNVNELSTMFPMVSLRVRIIELKDAEPNNLSNGQVIRDSKGHPTQKLQMIVRDATGGVRITFWKVTEEAVRAFRVGTCALFFNVKVARVVEWCRGNWLMKHITNSRVKKENKRS